MLVIRLFLTNPAYADFTVSTNYRSLCGGKCYLEDILFKGAVANKHDMSNPKERGDFNRILFLLSLFTFFFLLISSAYSPRPDIENRSNELFHQFPESGNVSNQLFSLFEDEKRRWWGG